MFFTHFDSIHPLFCPIWPTFWSLYCVMRYQISLIWTNDYFYIILVEHFALELSEKHAFLIMLVFEVFDLCRFKSHSRASIMNF